MAIEPMPQPATASSACTPLALHECRVWWATITDAGAHLESLLSPQEHERRRSYVQTDDRRRFVTAAALVRRAAGACLSVDPSQLRVDRRCRSCGAQHGKPRLPAHPDLDVSIAHAGEHVAVALACGPRVGVDVERLRDIDASALAQSTFARDEAAALAALPAVEREAAFLRLWTRKESIVKALGVGITDDFAAVSPQTAGASLHELPCPAGYVATLATIGRCDRLTALDGAPLLRDEPAP